MTTLTDEEILQPGPLDFPNGGKTNVHRLSNGKAYYARQMPGSDEWELLVTSIPRFLDAVRNAGGRRP